MKKTRHFVVQFSIFNQFLASSVPYSRLFILTLMRNKKSLTVSVSVFPSINIIENFCISDRNKIEKEEKSSFVEITKCNKTRMTIEDKVQHESK